MNLWLLIGLLLLGYLIKVFSIIMGESHANITSIISYVKEKDIETLVDVLIIIAVSGVWYNIDVITIPIPQLQTIAKSVWIAPFISFFATKIWQIIAEKITGEKIT